MASVTDVGTFRAADYTAHLFDLDGVITPPAAVHVRAWAQMFTDFLSSRGASAPYTDQDYFAYVDGRPRYDGVRTFLASRSIELPEGGDTDPSTQALGQETVRGLGNRKNDLLLDLIRTAGVRPYPGTVAFRSERPVHGSGLLRLRRRAPSVRRGAHLPGLALHRAARGRGHRSLHPGTGSGDRPRPGQSQERPGAGPDPHRGRAALPRHGRLPRRAARHGPPGDRLLLPQRGGGAAGGGPAGTLRAHRRRQRRRPGGPARQTRTGHLRARRRAARRPPRGDRGLRGRGLRGAGRRRRPLRGGDRGGPRCRPPGPVRRRRDARRRRPRGDRMTRLRSVPTDPVDRIHLPVDEWRLVESRPDGDLGLMETLFVTANGFLGMRGTPEEGRDAAHHGTFLNGFHETWPINHAESAFGFARTGQTMISVPDSSVMKLYVDDEPLLLSIADVVEYERWIDFREGVLRRDLVWRTPAGKHVKVSTSRMVSFTQRHLALMTMEISMLDGEVETDRKSTRLNSSHVAISYAVFCLKKKRE